VFRYIKVNGGVSGRNGHHAAPQFHINRRVSAAGGSHRIGQVRRFIDVFNRINKSYFQGLKREQIRINKISDGVGTQE